MTVSVSLDDGEIHVYQDGDHAAPALLLIHGTAMSARAWEPLVPLLTGSHHVIRIDLSDRPHDASYAIPDQAHRAGSVLDRLGVEHAIVVGHSSGGAVATALAEQRPDLVTALVLIDSGPNMAAYIGQEVAIDPEQWPDVSDDELRRAARSAFAPGYQIPQSFLDQVRDMDLRVFAATSQALRAYLDEQLLPKRLATVGKPLLVIFGEEDLRWRPSSAGEYSAVPGAIVEMLPGIGHSPHIEDPSRTAAPLLGFTASQMEL